MKAELFEGDCNDVLDFLIMTGVKVDLIVTSPPYNLGHSKRTDGYHPKASRVKYASYSDDLALDAYADWQIEVLAKCHALLSDRGVIYYNHKQRHKDGVYFHPVTLVQESPFSVLRNIIWKRAGGTNFNIGRFVNCHEDIIVGYKTKSYMKISKESEKFFDVWEIPQSKGDGHPASFPLALPLRILEAYRGHEGVTVLDPFMGSGTTGVASKMLGFNFIGIEMDKGYFELSKERILK